MTPQSVRLMVSSAMALKVLLSGLWAQQELVGLPSLVRRHSSRLVA